MAGIIRFKESGGEGNRTPVQLLSRKLLLEALIHYGPVRPDPRGTRKFFQSLSARGNADQTQNVWAQHIPAVVCDGKPEGLAVDFRSLYF